MLTSLLVPHLFHICAEPVKAIFSDRATKILTFIHAFVVLELSSEFSHYSSQRFVSIPLQYKRSETVWSSIPSVCAFFL